MFSYYNGIHSSIAGQEIFNGQSTKIYIHRRASDKYLYPQREREGIGENTSDITPTNIHVIVDYFDNASDSHNISWYARVH
jgi:ribosome biogenesis protein Nip4